jgi:heme/copper-type cytochrome/quinol oxidase subunit 2
LEFLELSSSRASLSDINAKSNFGGLTTRLKITSGLVLPADTPIHIICGSKDVIHS